MLKRILTSYEKCNDGYKFRSRCVNVIDTMLNFLFFFLCATILDEKYRRGVQRANEKMLILIISSTFRCGLLIGAGSENAGLFWNTAKSFFVCVGGLFGFKTFLLPY